MVLFFFAICVVLKVYKIRKCLSYFLYLKVHFWLTLNTAGLRKKGLSVPGSLLNIDLIADHPLTLGMKKKAQVFSRGRPVFGTWVPYFDMDRRVIGTFDEEEVLASGFVDEGELLEGKSAMVWAKKGRGQFVFYGFYPQFRASTAGTYKLLFNALLLNK